MWPDWSGIDSGGLKFVAMAQFVKSMGVVLLLVVSLAVVASAAPPRPSDWKLCGEFLELSHSGVGSTGFDLLRGVG